MRNTKLTVKEYEIIREYLHDVEGALDYIIENDSTVERACKQKKITPTVFNSITNIISQSLGCSRELLKSKEMDSILLSELQMCPTLYRALTKNGYRYASELSGIKLSNALKLRGIGKINLLNLRRFLDKYKINYDNDVDF